MMYMEYTPKFWSILCYRHTYKAYKRVELITWFVYRSLLPNRFYHVYL